MTPRRRHIGWIVTALAWCAGGASLLACPICFQLEQGPVTAGVRAAIVVLVAVTVGVLVAFGRFAARLACAERALIRAEALTMQAPPNPNPGTSEPRNPGTTRALLT